ncbi:hypothetical protein CPB84DRAFT_1854172 [Gymnopilus junonius]|uniref:Uncharacterized protein n=1 Tax=Gymnopilus junonius TaxID=109634 RepID=A0A9P5NB07_GYMJU|nr:hypothetical protein CPB84DRAFT_1854172 [Gymnopilus junonius]
MSGTIPALLSSVAVMVAAFALFIWALAKQGNGGPLFTNPEEIEGIGKLNPGSMLGWVMVHCITSGIGGWAGGTHEGPAVHAAVFFTAFAFFISQLCIGIIACGIVGGMDLAALVPK